MNAMEKQLLEMIEQDGGKTAVRALIRAFVEHGHAMSDLGLKEAAVKANNSASILKEVLVKIEE